MSADRPGWSLLAWAGWSVSIPEDWRPLAIEGLWDEGALVVGDVSRPLFSVRWSRPRGRFRPEKWIASRVEAHGGTQPSLRAPDVAARPARDGRRPPALALEGRAGGEAHIGRPAGFEHWAHVPGAKSLSRRDRGLRRGPEGDVWCGHSGLAGVAVEIACGAETPAKTARRIGVKVVPTLACAGAGDPVRWAVFDAAFVTPPGMRLAAKRLNLGDIALAVESRAGARLVVRQVYPAGLALSRRGLDEWLADEPFAESRRFVRSGPPEALRVPGPGGRSLPGRVLRGERRMRFPLSWLFPARSVAAAVVRPDLDRILAARCDSARRARTPDEDAVVEALSAMGRAKFAR